jgi:putative ABC transport system permease protein
LRNHLELEAEEQQEAGMSSEEAAHAARRALGNTTLIKEDARAAWGFQWLETLLQDLRYGLRQLRRNPGFTTVAVLTLALGIGANTAIFSVVNTILLRPLPLADSQQLVWIAPPPTKCGLSCETYSADAYEEFRAQNHSFQDVAGYFAFSSQDNYKLTGRGEPLPATGILVTWNFFQVLGVRPSLGRLFTSSEARKGGNRVALLANAYWKRQFGGDPGFVGKALDLNGQPVTVAGVLPPSFDFGSVFSPGARVDLFAPLILDDARDWGNIMTMIGRLKPGVGLPQAQADASVVAPQLYFNTKYPGTKGEYKAMSLTPLKKYVTGRLRNPLLILWCAVGAILLIVCVNLSNLLLVRAAARSREFALRSALGAGRMRLVRQLLTESLVLSAGGAVLGLGVADAITSFLAHQGSIALPLLGNVRVDAAALTWILLLTLIVAMLFGVLPALRVSSGSLQESLKDSGPGMSEGKQHERVRAALVVSEVALACVLLVGAGLLLRSFLGVLDVNLGFQPSRAAAIKVDYDDGGGPAGGGSAAKRSVIFRQILNHIEAVPGVQAAGIVDYLPLGRNRTWGSLEAKGKVYRQGEAPEPLVYVATPGFLRSMGMRLVAGRDFSWDDGPTSQKVIIINQALAQALWPNRDAVGQVAVHGPNNFLVVGVADDVRATSVEEAPGWQVYYPATQVGPAGATLVFRTSLPPQSVAASVLRTLRQLNPKQAAVPIEPIQQIVDHAISPRLFFMLLVTCFGAFGLILASLGIYGVISYSVTRRTHEVGIRMALGAGKSDVLRMVVGQGFRLAVIGVAIGATGSLFLTQFLASLLYGVKPTDPLTFIAVSLILIAVAFLACYIPARRAAKVDPMVALRYE